MQNTIYLRSIPTQTYYMIKINEDGFALLLIVPYMHSIIKEQTNQ